MIVGYARVSRQDQNLDLQEDGLKKAGCEKIFSDKLSGAKDAREGLDRVMDALRKGDTLVVWKLDRLGRSLSHLVQMINELKDEGIGFKSLQENIDTTSGIGKLVFHIFASLAEFERDLIRDRTMAGLASARARGKMGGRPRRLDTKEVTLAKSMYRDKKNSVMDICSALGIGKTTLYRYLNDSRYVDEAETEEDTEQKKTIKVGLWLRVENNSKFVRGKKRSREEIESFLQRYYDMKKLQKDGWEYELTIPYETDKDLDDTIHEITGEMDSIADSRNGFIECDIRALDGSERAW